MDHQQIESSGTIESYALGLLTPRQMDDFEVHCFECPECSKQLNQTAMFLTNARVVLREQLPEANQSFVKPIAFPVSAGTLLQRFLSSFRTAAPVFASLLFLALYTNEALVVNPALQRELDSPENFQSAGYFPLKGDVRGDDDTFTFSRDKKFVSFYFDFDTQSTAQYFVCYVRKPKGEQVKFNVSRPPPDRQMYVHLPTRDLESGKYELTIQEPDNPNSKIKEYSFQLQLK